MAEEPKTDGYEMAFWAKVTIGILILLLVVPAFLTGEDLGFFTKDNPGNTIENLESRKNFFTLDNLIGSGNLELGKKVIASEELQVRRSPGGQILGLQEKLSNGKLIEGPVSAFQTFWWRVNFENAPSGWVEFNQISDRVKSYKTIYFPATFYKGFKPIGWILSILLLIVVLIIKAGITKQHKILEKQMSVQDEQVERQRESQQDDIRNALGLPSEENRYKNQRWEHVLELMKSNSQNDWRQAIIEADIILDEMLRRMSYKGLTIGDMLKSVDPADFATLQKAWDAHKFRNEIAHTGSEFKISKEEAERVIDLYRSVFDEFYFI